MSRHLEELWAKMSLTEVEDDVVAVDKDWIEDTLDVGRNCLIGKVLSRRRVNVEAMQTLFGKIWRTSKGFQIKEVGDKLFIFHFDDCVDKEVVLANQPWTFNKSLIVMQEFDGFSTPESIDLEWCPFWIQIHGLPLAMMNDKVAKAIAVKIGSLLEVDGEDEMAHWGKYIRVKVNINIRQPLKRGTRMALPNGNSIMVMFQYEKLSDFCYVCGRLDHVEGECAEAFRLKRSSTQVTKSYGPWLRAAFGKGSPMPGCLKMTRETVGVLSKRFVEITTVMLRREPLRIVHRQQSVSKGNKQL